MLKKLLNVFLLLLVCIVSLLNYWNLVTMFTIYFLLGHMNVSSWLDTGRTYTTLLLSILTGITFILLYKYRLKKGIIIFSLVQVFLLLYSIFEIFDLFVYPLKKLMVPLIKTMILLHHLF